jgi:hypothetical protein
MAVEMATYWNIIVTQGFKNHLFAWTSACGGEKFSDPWYDIWMGDFGTVLLKVLMFVPTLFTWKVWLALQYTTSACAAKLHDFPRGRAEKIKGVTMS